ncbi:hypothetical protein PVA45_00475 [Entomospira entomophila]|uniref:Uncharacterized protein n=1 Tax=Entomospira entomophila TaxID=2719988 RepID=A0A968G8M0_9SPIO|nr:hypothetical protein [Entomospira entomophilus]NIZ39996.1 hypothetical protein [Entomospira entomophilus]WDI35556.1 hypothetical protein PVA45_00475 [Entomospira entomophilus]
MIGEGQAIIHFLANHYEKEIAQHLYPFWYHYYSYIHDHYADITHDVVHSSQWIDEITNLSMNCQERLFFYSKLPLLDTEQKHHFLSSIQSRIQDDIAIGLCLPHTLQNSEHVLGLWENTSREHMRLHVRHDDIHFGFVVIDDQLYFERPTHAQDTKRHVYHVKHVREETIAYLLQNPHLKVPKILQSYFLQ